MALGILMGLSTVGKFLSGKNVERGLDSADNVINKLASGIDKFTYTKQEQAIAGGKALSEYVDWVKSTVGQDSPQSRARRTIAILWVRYYLTIITLAIGLRIYADSKAVLVEGKWVHTTALHETAIFVKEIALMLGTGTLVILGFYFGVHLLRGFKKG